jgi:CHAD domain-containing protein
VHAYAAVLPWATSETLHALRIEGKRFRYALEFFREELGPRAERLVADITVLQDHLGELHDRDVALRRLETFLLRGTPAPPAPDAKKAIGDYAVACEARLRLLQRTIGRPWRRIDSDGFRRLLALTVPADAR